MTVIDRNTNLTPFVGVPVTFTREVPGEARNRTHTYIGIFTSLAHNWAHPLPQYHSDDASGMFEYRDERGARQRTGMHVPYGSTIEAA